MEQLPHQVSSVVKTCVRINSGEASHEEKCRRVPTKPKEKIQVHKKRVRRGLNIPMVTDGGEGKKLKNVVLSRILRISGGKTQKMTEFFCW